MVKSLGTGTVHGDIRRLEKFVFSGVTSLNVHGDIRRLENCVCIACEELGVHGDIRRLETKKNACSPPRSCSWRHTPFRNV